MIRTLCAGGVLMTLQCENRQSAVYAKRKLREDIEQALRTYWSNNDFDVGSVEITIDSHRGRDIETDSGFRIENDITLNEFVALVANGNN